MDRDGLEPSTSRLKVWRSTAELAILIVEQSAGLEPVFTSLEGSGPTLRPRLHYMGLPLSRRPPDGVAAGDHLEPVFELDATRVHRSPCRHTAPLAFAPVAIPPVDVDRHLSGLSLPVDQPALAERFPPRRLDGRNSVLVDFPADAIGPAGRRLLVLYKLPA